MPKRNHNKDEVAYMSRVASLPCAACQESPVEVHHIREGQGMGQRSSPYLSIPLCVSCHRGNYGTHGRDRKLFHSMYGSELEMLAETIRHLVIK